MDYQKIFKERLVKARNIKGLTQAALAKKIGYLPSIISHFEAGRRAPSFHNMIKLANALNVSIDYLTGIKNKEFICQAVWARPEDWSKIRKLEKKLKEQAEKN